MKVQKNIPDKTFKKISEIPNAPTIFIGNEFLDVFPIKQYKRINEQWKEAFILIDNDQFRYCFNDIESTEFFSEYKDTILKKQIFLKSIR